MLLTLIHRRLPDRATLLKVGAGWHMHLDILSRVHTSSMRTQRRSAIEASTASITRVIL